MKKKKSGWKTKPKKASPKEDPSLISALKHYNESAKALVDFESEYEEVITAYNDLRVRQAEAKDQLTVTTKTLKMKHGLHTIAKLDDGLTLQLDMKNKRRSVDPSLLVDHPELVSFDGLITIKVGALDQVVAGKLLTAEEAGSYISGGRGGELNPAVSFIVEAPAEG